MRSLPARSHSVSLPTVRTPFAVLLPVTLMMSRQCDREECALICMQSGECRFRPLQAWCTNSLYEAVTQHVQRHSSKANVMVVKQRLRSKQHGTRQAWNARPCTVCGSAHHGTPQRGVRSPPP